MVLAFENGNFAENTFQGLKFFHYLFRWVNEQNKLTLLSTPGAGGRSAPFNMEFSNDRWKTAGVCETPRRKLAFWLILVGHQIM